MGTTVYDKLGFSEDEIAIGVDPEEVLEWLGTKEQLTAKFLKDNPQFDDERVSTEISRFMLDAEMVDKYIQFERRKKDPLAIRQEAEESLSDPSVWGTYAAWIIGGIGFALVKNLYIEPKYASGEWEEIRVTIPNLFNKVLILPPLFKITPPFHFSIIPVFKLQGAVEKMLTY